MSASAPVVWLQPGSPLTAAISDADSTIKITVTLDGAAKATHERATSLAPLLEPLLPLLASNAETAALAKQLQKISCQM